MRDWLVGGAVIEGPAGLLLVRNRRRDGSFDWSPPGGVIDLVVSNVLLAMGMMMMSPVTVSLPFKLLLFVLIDGWVKLVHGLVLSYH